MKPASSERGSALRSLKAAAKSVVYFAGGFHARERIARLRRKGRRLLVLVYHNLSDPGDQSDLERRLFDLRPVTPLAHFECLIGVLARSYRVVPLAQGARELDESPQVDQLSVAITFDDGYRAFLTRAMPILERHEFPATVFLATDYIDQGKAFWWDELAQLVAGSEWTPDLLRELADTTGGRVSTGLPAGPSARHTKTQMLALLERFLAPLPSVERVERFGRLRQLFIDSGARQPEPVPLLSWEDVRGLAHRRVSFGTHTCSHMNLAGASAEAREREIGQSVRRLEAELGHRTELFAYPYGMEPDGYRDSLPILQKHGIRYARTMMPGVNSGDTDPLLLCRAPVTEVAMPHRLRSDLLQAAVP